VVGAVLSASTPAAHVSAYGQAVFVQTYDPLGNSIAAFHRIAGGRLSLAADYPTGGDGGREVSARSDPLGSQGSLAFDCARLCTNMVRATTTEELAVSRACQYVDQAAAMVLMVTREHRRSNRPA